MKLRWVAFAAAVAVMAAMFATTMYKEYSRQTELKKLIQQKTQALEEAQDRLSRMRDRVEFFKTEEGQAWIARDKLNMAFSGEEIYKIEGTPSSGDAAENGKSAGKEKQNP
ncbi:MAG: cell division protein [Pyramidobacter sp.]